MTDSESLWAAEVFGHARLGDLRRTDRLVQVAAAAARTPGGLVTEVMRTSATKEGAFRLLENANVEPADITEAMAISTARACRKLARVYVALDQSAINFPDRDNLRGLGKVGDSRRTRGLQAMTGLVLAPDGMPIGIGAMRWFSRPDAPSGWGENDTRPVEDRESALWLDAIDDVARVFAEHAPHTTPCFLLDRGGDNVLVAPEEAALQVVDLGRHIWTVHDRLRQDQFNPGGALSDRGLGEIDARFDGTRVTQRRLIAGGRRHKVTPAGNGAEPGSGLA